jgi:hypothetical protein
MAAFVLLAVPGIASATVFGDDDRRRAGSVLTTREVALYQATQRIFCQAPGGKSHGGGGSLASDFMHGISVAHLFYDANLRRMHTAEECWLSVYDGAGKRLEKIRIARLWTMWDGGRRRLGTDLAMFELAERPMHVDTYLSLEGQPAPLKNGDEVLVVAFHFDLEPKNTKRKTRGRVYSTLGTGDAGVRNIFHTDADWVPQSSGGPIYNSTGTLVALVQGNSSPEGEFRHLSDKFDAVHDFNRAIRLDPEFLRKYAEFVQGR